MKEYAEVPSAATLRPVPFEVKIDDDKLHELKILIKQSKVAPDTYENTQEDGRFGVSNKWITDAKDHWENTFDWYVFSSSMIGRRSKHPGRRSHESKINSFPNFVVPIIDPPSGESIQIHFVALFSRKPKAIPVVLMHGWPGSFLEFLPMLDLLREKYTPETLPYHAIVPSSPGYAFSELPGGAYPHITSESITSSWEIQGETSLWKI